MHFKAVRFTVAALLASTLAACAARESSVLPSGAAGTSGISPSIRERIPSIGGIYKGTVVETSGKQSIKAPLKITIRQSGDKFTGIFDIITKEVSDEFPILKGTVSSSNGKTYLRFIIEGSPHRNARAHAALAGTTITGKAKVSGKHGPVVRFTYAAKKA